MEILIEYVFLIKKSPLILFDNSTEKVPILILLK